MSALNWTRKAAVAALGIAVLAPMAASIVPAAQARPSSTGDPGFTQVWERTDKPVEDRTVARSWMWGPDTIYTGYEPYAQGPAGQHLVAYFDKSRMEINNPAGDRNSQWFVTNGLLVVDMISGKIQAGDRQFTPFRPANIPVAGDANGSPETPTYASLASVASLDGDNRANNRVGQNIREGLGRTSGVVTLDNLGSYAKYGVYEPTTGHNIADVFWTFMNQKGPVYQNGQVVNGTVVDWLFAMGYPVTEPYWIKIKVDNQDRWVLMQAFQRRILTYSPFNSAGFQVEMGNVGRAYYDWRYRQPVATPTPIPAPAISIAPSAGDITTTIPITITGKGFPAYAAVILSVEKASSNYSRNLATVAANETGAFTSTVNLPANAPKGGDLTIAATANGGAIKVMQTYRYQALVLSSQEAVTNGDLDVQGYGFPANTDTNVGIQVGTGRPAFVATFKTTDAGTFDIRILVGNKAVGSTFKVVAQTSDQSLTLTSKEVKVIAQPSVQVVPASGPADVTVTLRGANWPSNRAITIGRRPANSRSDLWYDEKATTDASGVFTATVYIGPEYATQGEARLMAKDEISTVRKDVIYQITPR